MRTFWVCLFFFSPENIVCAHHTDRKVNLRVYTPNNKNKSAYTHNSASEDMAGHFIEEKFELKILGGNFWIFLLNSSFDHWVVINYLCISQLPYIQLSLGFIITSSSFIQSPKNTTPSWLMLTFPIPICKWAISPPNVQSLNYQRQFVRKGKKDSL